ncbi:MAG: sigma-70 family RNA polymerase sigma factor [Frankiaceae bacterium]
MDGHDELGARFEEHRRHLRGVTMRMLGSGAEADDAVQEAWLRLSRADADSVANLRGWLTTVVARVALDMLRARGARQRVEGLAAGDLTELGELAPAAGDDPEQQAVLADSVGTALLVVLDTLAPTERLAFVLHDMFSVPFDDIAVILERSPEATKQLAYRGRRKVQGAGRDAETDPVRQREVIDAFLAASRGGEFDRLIALLHPGVALHADATAVRMGAPESLAGPAAVAGMFSGRALAATAASLDGDIGIMWAVDGRPKVVWDFTIRDGRVVAVEMIADPDHLAAMDLVALD